LAVDQFFFWEVVFWFPSSVSRNFEKNRRTQPIDLG
jgi:hypothetical protein